MPPAPPRAHRRFLPAVALGALLVLIPAAPAAADPPAPTNYRSEVVDVSPATDAVEISVVGGDGFLQIDVAPGHTVEVPGYSDEPYLRVRKDGTVEENRSSAAAYLNESRTRTDVDRDYDPEAEPRWEVVATDGRWAWHDHRIHYMGKGEAPGARSAEGVAWEVPLTVDGEDVTVTGRYRLLDAPSPWPWVAVALVALLAALALARVLAPVSAAGVVLLVIGAGGVAAGVAQRGASPPGGSTSPLVVILPALALVGGVIIVMQRGRVLRAVVGLAGAAAAGGWALVRLGVLWHAELPTSLDPTLDRFLTALALGGAVGAAVVVVRSGALAPPVPALDDPEPAPPGPMDG